VLAIVLATYNGERFLPELLGSLRGQTVRDWRLLVRDDGSTDGTVDLVRRTAELDPRIELFADDFGRRGPSGSFGALLEEAVRRGAAHVALADQDDAWLPDKLERQLAALRAAERTAGTDRPILVHTDLAVVDEQLRPRHPSMIRLQRLEAGRERPLRALLFHNCVTGCTALANRALLERALPIPERAMMHDWWLGQCAAAFGNLVFLDTATLLYRQHGNNAVGSQSPWARLRALLDPRRRSALLDFRGVLDQAAELRHRTLPFDDVDPAVGILLDTFASIFDRPRSGLVRIADLRRQGLPDAHLVRRLLTYARVLCLGRHPVWPAVEETTQGHALLRRAA
jgi:hypothetical protein